MSFVRYWIAQGMEDPEESLAKIEKHTIKVQEGADKLKERWQLKATRPYGYWNMTKATHNTRARLAQAEVTPTSPYAQALKDLDAKERRQQLAAEMEKK